MTARDVEVIPNQHVLWHYVPRGYYGETCYKAIVVKVTPKTVTITNPNGTDKKTVRKENIIVKDW